MHTCPNCGRALPPDARQCPLCGAPIACHAAPPSPAQAFHPRTAAAPGPRYSPARTTEADGGLTTSQYFWSLVLFSIPLVGWFFLFYWAFSAGTQPQRRRLARAYLMRTGIFLAVLLVLLAIVMIVTAAILGQALYYQQYESFTPYMPGPDPFYEEFNRRPSPFGPYNDYDPFFEQAPGWAD